MKISLLRKNKLGFIDGSCSGESTEESLRGLWDCMNAIVIAWIINVVSKDLLSGVVYSTNAKQVWKDLQERFDKPHGTWVFHLLCQIYTL